MKIEYEGESYLFEFDDITIKQAMKLEKHTGMKLTDWGAALEEGNHWLALQALGWLVLFEGKGAVDDADFKLGPLADGFTKALAVLAVEEAAKADGPVPTADVPASNGRTSAAVQDLSPLSSVPVSP